MIFNSMSAYVDAHGEVTVTFFNNSTHDYHYEPEYDVLGNRVVMDKSTGEYVPCGMQEDRDFLAESIMRSRRTAIDYALNNEWNYFFTQTISAKRLYKQGLSKCLRKKKYKISVGCLKRTRDRRFLLPRLFQRIHNNYVYKRLLSALKWYKKHYDSGFRYLIFAELHKSGLVHFHGLVYLSPANTDTITQHYDVRKNCQYWRSRYFFRFGATRFDTIRTNAHYVALYCSEYITKETTRIFPHSYVCSRGLKRSVKFCSATDESAIVSRRTLHTASIQGSCKCVVLNDFAHVFKLDESQFFALFPQFAQ